MNAILERDPLHPGAYRDPNWFESERKHLLDPNWLAVAHTSQLDGPGSYVASDLNGSPVVVVVQTDGSLKGLSNVCRHRNFPVASGQGKAACLACPYHAWTYELDGRLRGAPYMKDTPGFDRSEVALPEIKIEEWHGFIFATLNQDAPSLAPQLKGLSETLAHCDIGRLSITGTTVLEQDWNWKVMAENFSEGYHHSTQHPETIPAHPTSLSQCLEPDDGPYWIYFNEGTNEEEPTELYGIGVFPHTLFAVNHSDSRTGVVWLHIQRPTANSHRMAISFLAEDPEPLTEAQMQRALAFHYEDQFLCRETQRGLNSALASLPILCHAQESVIERFHGWIRQQFKGINEPEELYG